MFLPALLVSGSGLALTRNIVASETIVAPSTALENLPVGSNTSQMSSLWMNVTVDNKHTGG